MLVLLAVALAGRRLVVETPGRTKKACDTPNKSESQKHAANLLSRLLFMLVGIRMAPSGLREGKKGPGWRCSVEEKPRWSRPRQAQHEREICCVSAMVWWYDIVSEYGNVNVIQEGSDLSGQPQTPTDRVVVVVW